MGGEGEKLPVCLFYMSLPRDFEPVFIVSAYFLEIRSLNHPNLSILPGKKMPPIFTISKIRATLIANQFQHVLALNNDHTISTIKKSRDYMIYVNMHSPVRLVSMTKTGIAS